MIIYHGEKLASVRSHAEDYRDYILDLYVYLRDAHKRKFQDESFQRVLWRRLESAAIPDTLEDGQDGQDSGPSKRCGHCKHKFGHSTVNCPLTLYKMVHVVALLKGVSGRSNAVKIITAFKKLVKPDSEDALILDAITAIRAEASIS